MHFVLSVAMELEQDRFRLTNPESASGLPPLPVLGILIGINITIGGRKAYIRK
jgi:hypothetical protein